MVLPELEEWVTLLEMDDASGDGHGDGTITLPMQAISLEEWIYSIFVE